MLWKAIVPFQQTNSSMAVGGGGENKNEKKGCQTIPQK